MPPGIFIFRLGGITYPLDLLQNLAGKAIDNFLKDMIPSLALLLMIAAVMLLTSLLVHVYLERRIADKLNFQLFALAERISPIRGDRT